MTILAGRLVAVAVALVVAAGCAARSKPQAAPDLGRAGELVRQGCYDCLLEARAIYDSAAGTAPAASRLPALEVELLLALREKELALDPSAAMTRARSMAVSLRPNVDAARILEVVESIAPDPVGTPRVDRSLPALLGGREGLAAAVQTIDASPFSPLFRAYLRIAAQCGRPPIDPAAPTAAAAPAAPLLTYRQAICDQSKLLEQVRAEVPRFVEVALYQGRAALGALPGSDGSRARGFFEEAYARFPNSPSVTFHLATVHQATGDCRKAQEFFTETLTLRPAHEEGRLGRVICRTYLSDSAGAIADATLLIDSAAANRADAYYWRAWNRRRNEELDMARADIEGARALRINGSVLTLAGMIEHDQKDFQKARDDLSRAREMDNTQCQASWYLGLVGYALEEWPESARGFAASADCYERLIATTEAQRAAIAARTDLEDSYRTRQLAGFDAAIKEDSTQKSAADLNAAINYARAGDVPNATIYMKRAAVDPERRLTVEDLRQVLGVPRW
jgi:hypothetical protein